MPPKRPNRHHCMPCTYSLGVYHHNKSSTQLTLFLMLNCRHIEASTVERVMFKQVPIDFVLSLPGHYQRARKLVETWKRADDHEVLYLFISEGCKDGTAPTRRQWQVGCCLYAPTFNCKCIIKHDPRWLAARARSWSHGPESEFTCLDHCPSRTLIFEKRRSQ